MQEAIGKGKGAEGEGEKLVIQYIYITILETLENPTPTGHPPKSEIWKILGPLIEDRPPYVKWFMN
jgi:hypothetical protein